jgi:Xaa-Pro dipeptidase
MAEQRTAHAPEFWMGGQTFKVPMSMHAEQRQRLVARMAKQGVQSGVALFQGAASTCRDDTDHEPLIRQESFFQFLFGVKEPDCFACINLATSKAILFVPRLPRSYQVWMGHVSPFLFPS